MKARAGVIAFVLLAGCAGTGPIVVPLREEATPAPPPTGRACRVVVATVDDERTNKDSLGAVDDRPLHADGIREWVADRLATLARAEDSRVAPDVATQIGIQQVFASRPTRTQLEAVVALTARFSAADGRTSQRSYRGVATRLNVMSRGTEFATALNDALDTAVAQIGEDALRLCPTRT